MSQQDQHREVMAHDERMALHKANAQQSRYGPSPAEQARLLETVIDSDLETTDRGLENLRAKDFPLSNFDEEADTWEFKHVQEILNMISKSRHPHPRSGLHGLARAWASGDPADRLQPIALDEFAQDEAYLLGTYSRSKRGEGMKQQETSAKQVTESRAFTDNNKETKSGILGKLPGR